MKSSFISHALTAAIVLNIVQAVLLHKFTTGAITLASANCGLLGC